MFPFYLQWLLQFYLKFSYSLILIFQDLSIIQQPNNSFLSSLNHLFHFYCLLKYHLSSNEHQGKSLTNQVSILLNYITLINLIFKLIGVSIFVDYFMPLWMEIKFLKILMHRSMQMIACFVITSLKLLEFLLHILWLLSLLNEFQLLKLNQLILLCVRQQCTKLINLLFWELFLLEYFNKSRQNMGKILTIHHLIYAIIIMLIHRFFQGIWEDCMIWEFKS